MRVTKPIDGTIDELENAKDTAVTLLKDNASKVALDLFYTDNLEELETGIRQLNDFSSKSWLLSALLLYSLIYNKDLYQQSGLRWADYAQQSRERLGIDNRDITQQLAAASFFIKYHKSLERLNFDPRGANTKLARANLALELTKDIDAVLRHLVSDTFAEFKEWYQSYKPSRNLPEPTENSRDDIKYSNGKFTIGDIEAITISNEIPESDRARLQGYIKTIFESIASGYEPAIIPVYDKKEASMMVRLRDRNRQQK